MKFYKLNGVWQSWDYLHNELGYAEHATRPTVFKSCADATWGEDAGNGYYDGDVSDMINGTFWTDADPTGWFDLDGLVWNSETYPADAAPSLLVKDGVASDALVITCDDGNYYLIRAIIDTTAWIPESEVEALGWRSPSFVVVDSTTGKVVSGCNQELTTYELPSVVLNSEDGYATYELPSVALPTPNVVIGIPVSGPVQTFWFTDNGRNETNDKMFTVVGNPLFDEDGSIARNELYDSAVPLSFMQHDGNMFEADSDSDIVRYLPVTDRLVLSIPGDSTTRDKSAWSVQCAKLFVLSCVNTQLPDVQIELPINEVGTYGTSITLPTIDGEYESGGKTWKPSAGDIGAFGSSYTLNADTVAHLIFEEVETYEEITLYLQSGSKRCQLSVSSSFTGDVDSERVYQLYTDEQCTTPWTGYDYSNDYEVGHYVNGEWNRYRDSVSAMPSSTAIYGIGYILMDTGFLWLCCNGRSSTSVTVTNIVVRIYPKGQQVFALYTNSSSVYDNTTINFNSFSGLFLKPGLSGDIYSGNWPSKSLIKVLGSAGNVVSEGYNDFNFATASGRLRLINAYGSAVAKSVRCALLTFGEPVYYAEFGSEIYFFSGANRSSCRLYEKYPEKLNFETGYTYKVIIPIALNGSATGGVQSAIDAIYFEPYSSTDQQAIIRTTSTAAFYLKAVWYIKTPIS